MSVPPRMLRSLILAMLFLSCWVLMGSAQGKKTAKNPVQRQKEPQPTPQQTSSAKPAQAQTVTDDDDDDPDLPSVAGIKIDKQTYLEMRSEYIGRIRGIDPNNPPDLHLRMDAIRTLERQEQQVYGDLAKSSHAARRSAISPFSPPSATTWTELGPSPIPNGQTQGTSVAVSGRVTAIAVHPSNPNIVYVGAAQGGVYRSLDGGATWTPMLDSALSLAVGAIAISPSQPSTVYVGTGEANFSLDSFFGVGVYRIDNADTTPVLVGPLNRDGGGNDVFTGSGISQIIVHPADPNTIFVAATSAASGRNGGASFPIPARGLFRSTNAAGPVGSVTFTKLTVATAGTPLGNRSVTDIAIDPSNPNNMVAAVFGNAAAGDGGYYVTSNALDPNPTFTQTLQLNARTMKFAVNKVGSTVTVLAGSGDTGTTGVLRVSTDGGNTWGAPVPAASGYCAAQCFYDAPVVIKPDDANTFFIGGQAGTLSLQKTINGGTSFTSPTATLHADTHVIVYAPSDFTVMYEGNDGGIWRSADGGNTWTSRNTPGFAATQFESLALHPLDREFMIGGTQDNGTEYKAPDGSWLLARGGDGGYTLIDQNAANTTNVTMYHTFFNSTGMNNQIEYEHLTGSIPGIWTPSGCFGGVSHNGITCTDRVLFYAPMALGPGSPNSVYFGSDRLYRSSDVGANNVLVSQAPISNFPGTTTSARVSAIGISPQNDNIRIVGLEDGQVFATTTGSSTLTEITGTLPPRYVAKAIIDPNNSNTAYVTFDSYGLPPGQHVWKTTNLNGAPPTWSASGNGIPDVPTNSIVVDPMNSNAVYAATDIGVYYSSDGGATWNPYGLGLPRVAVFEVAIQSPNRVLRVATHGRGIWEIATAPLASTTTASSSLNPSVFGQPVTLTANVVPAGSSGTPTGTVQFEEGANNLGAPATLSGGIATLMVSTLGAGTHNITAVYSGDLTFAPSTGFLPTQTVNQASSSTALVSGTNPSIFGQSVTFTATISALPPGGGTSTGTVTFMDGGTTIGTGILSGGVALFTTNALAVASHSVTAVYPGDANFIGSTSTPALTQTVTGGGGAPADIGVAVTLSPNNPVIAIGGKLTATVTVSNLDATNSAQVALNFNTITGPVEIDAVNAPAGASCNTSGPSVQCSIATLSASTNKVFTVTLRPLSSDVRTLTAIANVSSNGTDSNLANNNASSTIKVRFKPFRH